jgi:signal transduction histidine kinase/ligand-binding sensor domain-containing protein
LPPLRHLSAWSALRHLAACIALLLAMPAQALDPDLSLAQLHHTAWRSDDGAPSNVLALAQTPDGYLWLGTGGGLVRFDGMRFQQVREFKGQALQPGSISALHTDSRGRLLVGYRHGGLSILGPEGVRHHREADGLPTGNAWAFADDGEGGLWAAFTGGIARLSQGRWQRFALDGEAVPFRNLLIDPEGSVWATAKTGAYVRPRGAPDFQRVDAELPAYPTLSLAPDGRVWAADFEHRRIGALVRDGAHYRSVAESQRLPFPATGDRHWFDAQGGLWVRTGEGVLRLPRPQAGAAANTPPSTFGIAQGLSGEFFCLLQDREGNVWIGTAGGLDRFRQSHVRRVALGAQDGGVGVAAADHGRVWATTEFGGLFRVGDRVEPFHPTGLRASHLHRDRQGRVWIGARNALWMINEQGQVQEMARPDASDGRQNLTFAPIHAMGQERDGSLWASLVIKGTFRRVGEQWQPVPKALGDRIMSMGRDSEDRLWLGYIDRGAARVDGGEQLFFSPKTGLDIGAVMAIHGRGPRVWLGGQRGLALYEGGVMRTLAFKGLDDLSVVSGIVETAAGQLWINAANGLTRIDAAEWRRALSDPAYRVRAERFDAQDGLLGSASQVRPLPSLIEAGDGKLWMALPTGLFVIDPASLLRNPLPPPVLIEALFANGIRHEPGAAVELPVGRADLRIDYTATSLTIPQRVRFRYKLEGYDRDWQEAGGRREASYTQVGPGHYVFRVIAANNDGVWNEAGASLALRVPPAFWQTPWFALACVALAALTAAALYRWRIRRLSARLRERLDVRLHERERIARELHDTLLQGVTGLTLHVEAVAQQLPAGTPLREELELALTRAQQAMADGRDRVSELRGTPISLPQTLAQACRELAELFPGPACHFAVEGAPRALDTRVADEVERIAREAVSNALRHAGGRHVWVELRFAPEGLALQVRDDGHGFALGPAEQPGHFGLAGMRERARYIGAQLEIHSDAGGSNVRLQVPAASAYRPPGSISAAAAPAD